MMWIPVAVAATVVGVYAVPNFVLPALGFTAAGVLAGSWAAGVMGPATVTGSAFAIAQSLGATGITIVGAAKAAGALLGVAAVATAAL